MIGEKIKLLRKTYGYTQSELGDKIGLSPSAIGMYENGRREPNSTILLKLSQLFEVDIGYFYEQPGQDKTLDAFLFRIKKEILEQDNITIDGYILKKNEIAALADTIVDEIRNMVVEKQYKK